MDLLPHMFALLVLAHLVWAAVILQRDWRRQRLADRLAGSKPERDLPVELTATELAKWRADRRTR
jgi:hypothetical protein